MGAGMDEGVQEGLRTALKRVAVGLKETEVPFALAGGYAVWARGGPEPDHDVDFLLRSVHAEAGKHQLQSSAKNEPATVIETVAGGTTYVQMVIFGELARRWKAATSRRRRRAKSNRQVEAAPRLRNEKGGRVRP